MLGRETLPPDPAFGSAPSPAVAVVREDDCIGCFKCVHACPVDAILGAPQMMHTVIARECTGCGLCLPPCPVDCIELHLLPAGETPLWSPDVARRRAAARRERVQRQDAAERSARDARRTEAALRARRTQTVKDAIARVRARRTNGRNEPGR